MRSFLVLVAVALAAAPAASAARTPVYPYRLVYAGSGTYDQEGLRIAFCGMSWRGTVTLTKAPS